MSTMFNIDIIANMSSIFLKEDSQFYKNSKEQNIN